MTDKQSITVRSDDTDTPVTITITQAEIDRMILRSFGPMPTSEED